MLNQFYSEIATEPEIGDLLAPDIPEEMPEWIRPYRPVTFHATYRDYFAYVLEVNEDTERAKIMLYDDVLDGGGWRVLRVDLLRLELLPTIYIYS